ncbi:TetR family transcriptional regulator [Tistrella bauzanensis]|uniref:TetR family transcriptional regulator n=1 Tax=Tistrella bauzanensis TaxID=657419 RepID=A0ABQ1J4I0_9PROT|nr:TetR/AcrR family transcriptional regulator [Tistrella bauzanensis]GGB58451.1 TetR family transcriptional regulator [Tistrella bauzanensis]
MTEHSDDSDGDGAAGTRPRRSNQQRSADTRRALIRAARALFAVHGYAATGTPEILARAGVSRGALYHQFPDKAALFQAVLEDAQANIVAAIDRAAHAAPDALHALRAGSRAFVTTATRPDIRQIVLIDGPAVLGWETWRKVDAAHGLGTLVLGLNALADEGRLRPGLSVQALALMLSGALNEAALGLAAADGRVTGPAVNMAIDALIDGIVLPSL